MSGNITKSQKQTNQERDWVTLGLLYTVLVPSTILFYRILNFSRDTKQVRKKKNEESRSKDASKNNATSKTGTRSASAPKKNEATLHPYKWLLKVNPLTLVSVTACMQYGRLILDIISWTYVITVKRWDIFVKIVDGFSTLIGTFSSCLLILVFIQRCFVTFLNTHVQHKAWIYTLVCSMAMLSVFSAIFMAVCTFSLQWTLLATASICFISTLFIASSLATWFFVSPLRALAKETKSVGLVHVAARLSIVSSVSLMSTVLSYLWAAIAYNYCTECNLTYIYYSMTTVDTVLNLWCMIWSLKAGQKEYYQMCRYCHAMCVSVLTPGDDDSNNLPINKSGTVGE